MRLLQKKYDSGKAFAREYKVCDGRCYRSTGKNCNCICEGKCHGKGLKASIEHVIENREYYEWQGVEVVVEDRLLFEIDPAKEK